jgi:hypothetical protein
LITTEEPAGELENARIIGNSKAIVFLGDDVQLDPGRTYSILLIVANLGLRKDVGLREEEQRESLIK